MALLGIDLGTTNSVVAAESHDANGRVEVLTSLPSVVAFLPNGTIRVGEVARRRRAIDSANTIFSSKRIIGRRIDASETRNFIERYPFEIVDANGEPAFRTRIGDITPTRIAATILEALLERAGIGPDAAEVVITVPASFREAQLAATREAAEWAGLGHARFIDEPSATATAYVQAEHPAQRALVYDLGGGTFDCAVLDCSTCTPRVLAYAGDLCLGGDDVDHALAQWVAAEILEKRNWDLRGYAEIYDRLLARCEDVKIALSSRPSAELELSQIDPECPGADDPVAISRSKVEDLCQDLVRRSFVTCDDVLRMANLRPPDIDAVFLAGGTTHMPVVREGVAAYFGFEGEMHFDPTEVVAIGARVTAGSVFT